MKPISDTESPAPTFPLWLSLETVSSLAAALAFQFQLSSSVTSALKGMVTDHFFVAAL